MVCHTHTSAEAGRECTALSAITAKRGIVAYTRCQCSPSLAQAKAMAGGEGTAPSGADAPANYGPKYEAHMADLQKQVEDATRT